MTLVVGEWGLFESINLLCRGTNRIVHYQSKGQMVQKKAVLVCGVQINGLVH